MAAATQQAPQPQKTQQAQPITKTGSAQPMKQETRAKIPQAAGIAGMAVLLAASLFVGNFRALQNATPKDFLRQGDVKYIIEQRIEDAGNAMTVARRAGLSDDVYADVDAAIAQMKKAKSARDISHANEKLIQSVSDMSAGAMDNLDGENQDMLTAALDEFNEQGSFLRQEARSYNEQAKKAQALYEKLPTRALLSEPDIYEGI